MTEARDDPNEGLIFGDMPESQLSLYLSVALSLIVFSNSVESLPRREAGAMHLHALRALRGRAT